MLETICLHEQTEPWCAACGKPISADHGCMTCGGGGMYSLRCVDCDSVQYAMNMAWEE